jgi:hypothetical protein
VNRGEITECTYVPRKAERRSDPQESSLDLSKTAQDKIDNLERIVRMLLENQQKTQEQNKSPSNPNDAEDGRGDHQNNCQNSQENLGDSEIPSSQTTIGLFHPSPPIKIDAVHEQRRTLDEAHWALLLNEVRNTFDHALI